MQPVIATEPFGKFPEKGSVIPGGKVEGEVTFVR
jgi:hypothetical protein